MINARVKSIAAKLLPHFLVAWLDPFQEAIETEVKTAAARLEPGGLVLDAGAGEGRHKHYFNRGTYVALDAATGDPSWDYSRLDLLGDLERIPLRTGAVDAVLCMVVLEHTRDPKQVLREFARVLRGGGSLYLVVPFLWEEHQAPHDYHRFTRHGVRLLMDCLPFRIEALEPIGGFFWLCARRCVNLLGFFQQGWRWLLFVPLAPVFGLLLPSALYFLDGLDHKRDFTLGFRIRAVREGN